LDQLSIIAGDNDDPFSPDPQRLEHAPMLGLRSTSVTRLDAAGP
jgi:hypothetical protein